MNGNPVDEKSTNNNRLGLRSGPTRIDAYSSSSDYRPLQQRQQSRQSSQFPSSMQCLNDNNYTLTGVSTSDMDDAATTDSKSARKKKKKDKQESRKSEEYPGFRGEDSVDKLLDFIENTGGKKKRKPVPTPSAVSIQNGPVHVEKEKNNKKLKKKTNNDKRSEYGSERGDDASSKVSDLSDEKMKDFASEVGSINSDLNSKDSQPTRVDDGLSSHGDDIAGNHVDDPMSSHGDDTVDDLVGLSHDEMAALLLSEDYKFTDIIMPQPVEEEFKVVSKKKKKADPLQTMVRKEWSTNHFHRESSSLHVPRETRRRGSSIRSKTPPANSTVTNQDKPVERSFSPSAFPVLGVGHSREGRRNSTGNVGEELNPDDSDMESVKSLPLGTSAGANSDGTMSPATSGGRPIVSYAKVAAQPKPAKGGAVVATNTNNVCKVPSVTSQTSIASNDSSLNVDKSKAGNDDMCCVKVDENNKEGRDSVESDVTVQDVNTPPADSSPVVQATPAAPHLIMDFPSLGESNNKTASSHKEAKVGACEVVRDVAVSTATVDISLTQPKMRATTTSNSPSYARTNTCSDSSQDVNDVSCHIKTKAVPPRVVMTLPAAQKTRNNHKKPKSVRQSVVFLDHKSDEPVNLDIEFGFDEGEVMVGSSESGLQQYSVSIGADTHVEFLGMEGFPPLPSSSQLTQTVSTSSVNPSPKPYYPFNNVKPPVAGMNGLVIPNTQGSHIVVVNVPEKGGAAIITHDNASAGLTFTGAADIADNRTSSIPPPHVVQMAALQPESTISHTVEEVAPSPLQPPASPPRVINVTNLQQIPFEVDPNYHRGRFDLEDAARHLFTGRSEHHA